MKKIAWFLVEFMFLFNTNDTDSDGEKGYDPVAFLVKRGISHKAFAQFLRER
jgi:hypothetical protein